MPWDGCCRCSSISGGLDSQAIRQTIALYYISTRAQRIPYLATSLRRCERPCRPRPNRCVQISKEIDLQVDLKATGRPPFQIMYNIAQDSELGGTKIMGQPTFNSIQPRTRFQLQTSQPGRVYYEVKQIGDAAYPLSKTRDMVIPLSDRLLFEQQVFMRPTARFRNRNRLVYCLNDALVPLDSSSSDGFVVLEGTPPFTLVLSIKNIGASHVEMRTIEVPTNSWRLHIPSYTFSSIGPHLVTIQKVTDSSSCEQAAFDPLLRSIWVDVAETASIIPFERREDICVGDVTQFQLEGIPPWTIGLVNVSF